MGHWIYIFLILVLLSKVRWIPTRRASSSTAPRWWLPRGSCTGSRWSPGTASATPALQRSGTSSTRARTRGGRISPSRWPGWVENSYWVKEPRGQSMGLGQLLWHTSTGKLCSSFSQVTFMINNDFSLKSITNYVRSPSASWYIKITDVEVCVNVL